jgi:DNA modification methylase
MRRLPLFEATNQSGHRSSTALSGDPTAHNGPQALVRLQDENALWRKQPWPEPYNKTQHRLHLGDARYLPWVESESVHLVATSPPYWTLKKYNDHPDQLGYIEDYEVFLEELDKVWRECARVLVPGGRVCCVVGDVCIPRRKNKGRHLVAPLHSDIQVRARKLGLDNLAPIMWYKISNGAQEATGNGRAYYGKPYQPNGVIKNDIEYVLFLRKGGQYRKPTHMQKVLSMLTKDEQRKWYQQIWSDIRGASTRTGHPAPYPVELASRLIRMFSFAGDTVLDPFVGMGSTSTAAVREGRNSIGNEIDPAYFNQAWVSVSSEANMTRSFGPVFAEVVRVE